MILNVKLGKDVFEEHVKEVGANTIPKAKVTSRRTMGQSGTNFYMVGKGAEDYSIYTDSVGPCHAVLVLEKLEEASSGLGRVGLVHVTGNHEVIMEEAEKLVTSLNSQHVCDVFIVGGDDGIEVTRWTWIRSRRSSET